MADFRDRVAKGVAGIVQDIAHKWEEFAWGRVVTPRSQTISIDTAGEQSLAERFGWSVPGEKTHGANEPGWFAQNFAPDKSRAIDHAEPALRTQEQDRGIDL